MTERGIFERAGLPVKTDAVNCEVIPRRVPITTATAVTPQVRQARLITPIKLLTSHIILRRRWVFV